MPVRHVTTQNITDLCHGLQWGLVIVGVIVGTTLAGAALLACIAGALLAVFLMKRSRNQAALTAPTDHRSQSSLAQHNQQKDQSTALQMNAAVVSQSATDTTSPEDVELIKAS